MTKTVQMHRKDWSYKLNEALWEYIITWKNTIGFTHQLVYGKQVLLPIEFQIHMFKLASDLGIDLSEAQIVVEKTILVQQRAQWHDKFIKKKQFKVGDWALLFDSKFQS